MKYLLLIALIITQPSLAQKTTGDAIKHQDFNSSVFNLGDIKQSLLPINKFQQLNGDCWVKMTGQNIASSDYGILTGETLLPNTQGKFLRDIGGGAAALGQAQDDALQGHRHMQFQSGVSGASIQSTTALVSTRSVYANTGGVASGDVVSDASNGVARVASETRPTNISVNYFIKINKVCNFN